MKEMSNLISTTLYLKHLELIHIFQYFYENIHALNVLVLRI
jgi:hypothetical protein